MKNVSNSILIYKTILNNNYKYLYGSLYLKNFYKNNILLILNLNKYLKYFLHNNFIYDKLIIISNNNIKLINIISLNIKNISYNNIPYNLHKLFVIMKNLMCNFNKKQPLNYINTINIFKNCFISIKFLNIFIKNELTCNTPIRKIFNKILYKFNNFMLNTLKFFIGIKIIITGRLNGSEKSMSEKFKYGNLCLQTLKVPVLYTNSYIITKYGVIGIKIWLTTSI